MKEVEVLELKKIRELSFKLYEELKILIIKLSEQDKECAFIDACEAVAKWEELDWHLERIEEEYSKEVSEK